MRRLIALLFILLLPLQTMASIAMPLRNGDAAGMAQQATMHDEHCGEHGDPLPHDGRGGPNGLVCDQCGICHLACAGMLPTAESTPARVAPECVYGEAREPYVSFHSPEPLSRPPLSFAA